MLARPSKATSGDITFVVETGAGVAIKIAADASSGMTAAMLTVGAEYRIVGVAASARVARVRSTAIASGPATHAT